MLVKNLDADYEAACIEDIVIRAENLNKEQKHLNLEKINY